MKHIDDVIGERTRTDGSYAIAHTLIKPARVFQYDIRKQLEGLAGAPLMGIGPGDLPQPRED